MAKSRVVSAKIGSEKLKLELALTGEEKARGLMKRTSLEGIDGMLFVFAEEHYPTFWMKDTLLPLSIGFFDKNFLLVDVQDMEPMRSEIQVDYPRYKSRKLAQYALEVPKGWFEKNNILVFKDSLVIHQDQKKD